MKKEEKNNWVLSKIQLPECMEISVSDITYSKECFILTKNGDVEVAYLRKAFNGKASWRFFEQDKNLNLDLDAVIAWKYVSVADREKIVSRNADPNSTKLLNIDLSEFDILSGLSKINLIFLQNKALEVLSLHNWKNGLPDIWERVFDRNFIPYDLNIFVSHNLDCDCVDVICYRVKLNEETNLLETNLDNNFFLLLSNLPVVK